MGAMPSSPLARAASMAPSSSSRATPDGARARNAREVADAVAGAGCRARGGAITTARTTGAAGVFTASMSVSYARLGGGVEEGMGGDRGARVVLVRAMIDRTRLGKSARWDG